jgi:hypothetical protein
MFRDCLKLRQWEPLLLCEYVYGIPISMLKFYVCKVYVCLVILMSLSWQFHSFRPCSCCVCLRPESCLCYFFITAFAMQMIVTQTPWYFIQRNMQIPYAWLGFVVIAMSTTGHFPCDFCRLLHNSLWVMIDTFLIFLVLSYSANVLCSLPVSNWFIFPFLLNFYYSCINLTHAYLFVESLPCCC